VTVHPEEAPGLQGATATITRGTVSCGPTMTVDLLSRATAASTYSAATGTSGTPRVVLSLIGAFANSLVTSEAQIGWSAQRSAILELSST